MYYRMGGNFCGGLIFADFVGPTQTMLKNSLKISADPQKVAFYIGLETTNLS